MIKVEVLLREPQHEVPPEAAVEESMSSDAFYLSLLMQDKVDLIKELHELNVEIRRLEESLRSGP